VHDIALAEQQFGEISAVLPGRAGDQRRTPVVHVQSTPIPQSNGTQSTFGPALIACDIIPGNAFARKDAGKPHAPVRRF
jgi:hypothetical protein